MKRLILAMVLGAYSLYAQAALIDRGGGLIYDSDQGITWLQDANYAQTSGHDADGEMDWNQAMTWAAGLSLTHNGIVHDDWRLPTTLVPDSACSGVWGTGMLNCSGSEMGHLFYIYGVSTGAPGIFMNVKGRASWSGTEVALDNADAWMFSFDFGDQGTNDKEVPYFAWAVIDGDIGAVPILAAAWLFGSALGLLGCMCRQAPWIT